MTTLIKSLLSEALLKPDTDMAHTQRKMAVQKYLELLNGYKLIDMGEYLNLKSKEIEHSKAEKNENV